MNNISIQMNQFNENVMQHRVKSLLTIGRMRLENRATIQRKQITTARRRKRRKTKFTVTFIWLLCHAV